MKAKEVSGWKRGLLGMIALTGSVAANAADESYFTMTVGYESSTGKYGTTFSTDIESVPLGMLYETGRWKWKLTVPYLRTTGTGTVIASGGGRGRRAVTSTASSSVRTTRSGWGDAVAMAIWSAYEAEDVDAGMDVALRVKFGTASKALGTGENDYAAQVYGYRAWGDFMPSMLVGYEMLGDSAELQFNNVFYGVAGLNYLLGDSTNVELDYRYAQRATPTSAAQREVFLYLNHEVTEDLFLRAFLQKGYSTSSPDSGFGLSLSVVY